MKALFDLIFGSSEPTYSDASIADAQAIAALHAASFHRGWSEDEIERLLLDRSILTHRAMVRRRLAGFIMSRIVAGEAEILSVAVDSAQQGRGLAQSLLRLHLGRLAGLGVRTVFLEVDEHNEPAIKLYRRTGFYEVGRRTGYYPDGPSGPSNALTLRRDLG
ncbi:MAG: ribosomal protein S18-alanine N-acetyltransferase [Pseudorhodoplanes sp.]|jgi:ribosomal-protein-alanine N-acetyltransferase|nr:ribosomal protein S18-alanine N-acetyltransferase [Pseudorhodoplanes sp.]